MLLNEELLRRYTTRTEKIDNGKGYWNYLRVTVLRDGEPIGEYVRNYSCFYNTFHPFIHKGKEYALYSPHYTATRVMSLPDCKDICGEEPCSWGFCPTGYAVPYDIYDAGGDTQDYIEKRFDGEFAFVCGCVWGDDGSLKIQFVDLSRLEEGILTRDDRFGYIELIGDSDDLAGSISLESYSPDRPIVYIAEKRRFDMREKK